MPINVTCPNLECNQVLRVPDRFLGVRVKCKFCQLSILVEVQDDPPPSAPGQETLELPVDNVFEQMTMTGPAPAPAPASGARAFEKRTFGGGSLPPSSSVFEKQTVAPAPAPVALDPPEPEFDGPPPLPRRPPGPPKIKVGALFVSLLSLTIICGSVAGIIILREPPEPLPPPIVGEKYAVIALESGGVRFVVAPIEKGASGYKLGELTLENRDIKLAPDKGEKGLDPAKVEQAMKEVSLFVDAAKQDEVPESNLFVVCNSGVLRDFSGESLSKAKAALETGVRDAGGGTLIFVEAEAEARFGAIGCVPPEDRTTAVLLDLGSGGVRGGYHDGGVRFVGFDLPLGRKKFLEAVKTKVEQEKSKRSFAAVAEQERTKLLNEPLRAARADQQVLVKRNKYHLIGGTAWAATVLMHPTELRLKRVALKPKDLEEFDALVTAPGQTVDALQAQARNKIPGLPEPDREIAEKEITAVGKTFKTMEDYIVMAKVLRAFSDECVFQSKDVRFFTNGLYAWPLGFLLTRSGVEK